MRYCKFDVANKNDDVKKKEVAKKKDLAKKFCQKERCSK
jgi:hypothetical protein